MKKRFNTYLYGVISAFLGLITIPLNTFAPIIFTIVWINYGISLIAMAIQVYIDSKKQGEQQSEEE